ncbi:MFS transporter [Arthrobacter sp. A5]|uniref:MFS transporter n=1 Tax=Arthrobacter sp. A5 TaxID=576926 RepID=UPI003DA7E83D
MNLRSRFWTLSALRWLPTGLIIPVHALLPLDRGLSIAELGAAFAVQGIVVLCLELPTGGFADAMGRKPVFIASAVVALASYVMFALADSVLWFALASGLTGVFRALDSGPLNAWYVDEMIDTGMNDGRGLGGGAAGKGDDGGIGGGRGKSVAKGLSGAGTITGLSIAAGAVLTGGIVAWNPFPSMDRLAVPIWLAAALTLVQITVTMLLMNEDRSARVGRLLGSVKATPRTIADGARLMWRSPVLRALVAVEVFWGFGMIGFETLMPIRLSEVLSGPDLAGSVMGPVSAAAWGISAAGALTVPLLLRRLSMVTVSVALRIVQGGTVIAMGLAAGPIGLIIAFFATYAVHTAAGAIYETLLHDQVGSRHRATALSLASMAAQPAGSVGAVVLGLLATGASTGLALVAAGVVLAMAAPLFLVKAKSAVKEKSRKAGAEWEERKAHCGGPNLESVRPVADRRTSRR